jgi:2-polyprenyl-3-methyl-5-hydroxy-6-metoxy-1,4-benzoquinol methylase
MISNISRDYIASNSKHHADELFVNLIMKSLMYNKKIEDITLLDYGGGTGLLSMQARKMGIGTVIYCDINPQMFQDSQVIAAKEGLLADHYVCGDIDQLIEYCRAHSLLIDSICSYDVIEHIADFEYFIKRLPELNNNNRINVVLSSGANIYNPLILMRTMRSHLRAEIYFRPLRKKLKNQGIEYIHSTILNPRHPVTGYWEERLMRFKYIRRLFAANGHKVCIEKGYYSSSNWRKLINPLISSAGFIFAPYYTCKVTIDSRNI